MYHGANVENRGVIIYSETVNLRYERADNIFGISGFILYNNRRDRSSYLRAIPLGPNLVIRVTLGILHSITIFDPWGIPIHIILLACLFVCMYVTIST